MGMPKTVMLSLMRSWITCDKPRLATKSMMRLPLRFRSTFFFVLNPRLLHEPQTRSVKELFPRSITPRAVQTTSYTPIPSLTQQWRPFEQQPPVSSPPPSVPSALLLPPAPMPPSKGPSQFASSVKPCPQPSLPYPNSTPPPSTSPPNPKTQKRKPSTSTAGRQNTPPRNRRCNRIH